LSVIEQGIAKAILEADVPPPAVVAAFSPEGTVSASGAAFTEPVNATAPTADTAPPVVVPEIEDTLSDPAEGRQDAEAPR